jgi:hypothetical protein
MQSTGYENLPNPESRPSQPSFKWNVEIDSIGRSANDEVEVVYARIELNEQTVGTMRLPNLESVKSLRKLLMKE